MKAPSKLLADIDIQSHLKRVNLPNDMILIHEYTALIKAALAASVMEEFSEDNFQNIIEVLERDVNQSIEKLKAHEQDLADASIKLKEGIKELTINLNGM